MDNIKEIDDTELESLLYEALKVERDSIKNLLAKVVRKKTCSWRQRLKWLGLRMETTTPLSFIEWLVAGSAEIGSARWLMRRGNELGMKRRLRRKLFLSFPFCMGWRFELNPLSKG